MGDALDSLASWSPESAAVAAGGPATIAVPPLEDEQVALKAVTQEDQPLLHLVETSTALAARRRFRGTTPSPEQWAHATWGSALAQFVVLEKPALTPAGIVAITHASFQDRHARLDAARFDLEARGPAVLHATALLLDYTFCCWDFHKVYVELPEHALPPLASGLGRLLHVEGRLREHVYLDGRRWDHVFLAVYRDRWQALRARAQARAPELRTDFAHFTEQVAAIADRPATAIGPDDRLVADLGLDSLALAEVAELLKPGTASPFADAVPTDRWADVTVRQLFELCGGGDDGT